MKYNYKLAALILINIFSFGESRGELFAQQLSPRYVRTARVGGKDSAITFDAAIPANNLKAELVGVATGKYGTGGPCRYGTCTDVFPLLYRMDSTGKYTSVQAYKFGNSPSNYTYFNEVLPYKDSLYIIGTTSDEASIYSDGANKFILKTDASGTIDWKKQWGDIAATEYISDHIICSDGGLAFCGYTDIGRLSDGNGGTYPAAKGTFAKYDAKGNIKFNKSLQIPMGAEIASQSTAPWFRAMAESPDKGYMLAGHGTPDPTTYDYNGIIRQTGLFIVKLDASGNKLWDRAIMFDYTQQYSKRLAINDMVADPAGGYILVGNADNLEWDPNGAHLQDPNAPYDPVSNRYMTWIKGGLMMKINEGGDVLWIKIFSNQIPITGGDRDLGMNFKHITLSSASGTPGGFILSGRTMYQITPPIYDTLYPYGNGPFTDAQTSILKTDLNGNLLWNREYGALVYEYADLATADNAVYEEPGGTIIANTLAAPSDSDIFVLPKNDLSPTVNGILRLDSKGYLQDPYCSLSPKLTVYNDDILVSYINNISFDYTKTKSSTTLPAVTIKHTALPGIKYGLCASPLWAGFTYKTACSASGSGGTVAFTNNSRGPSLFHYDFGDHTISDSANVHHSYSTSGTYTVSLTVWDSDSSKTDTYKKVIVIPAMRYVSLLPGDTTICRGASFDVKATINSGFFSKNKGGFRQKVGNDFNFGVDNYASTYTDTTFFSIPIDTAITITLYYDPYNDACISGDTVVIKVLPSVNMKARGAKILCIGDSALLIASGSKTFLWKPENSLNDSLMVYPITTKTYTVSSGQATFCGTDTASIKVIVNQNPLVNINTEQTIYPGQQAHLLVSGGINYLWSPAAGLNSISTANPTAEPTLTTMYFVKVTDANGCVSSDSVIVNLKTCGVDMFVPNAFSPNGDNQNDVFYLKTLNNDCIQSITFKIFDRWGNKVFESSDINIGWNGVYNGKAMDANVFVYFLNATLETGEIITQKGNISLLR